MSAKFTKVIKDKFREHNAASSEERLLIFSNLINTKNYITNQISQQMHKILLARKRFVYSAYDICWYYFWCLYCRSKKYMKGKEKFKKHFYYRKGENKV
jgi:ERCC4-related helicase